MSVENKRKLIRKTLLFFSVGICLALVAGVQSAFAQTTGSATLRGVIRDPQSAVVGGATVTLTNEATGASRQVKTTDEGAYVFSAMTPGSYGLKVEFQGFKTVEQKGVSLAPSDNKGVDITLELGAPSDVVTVQAAAVDTIQTETGSKENTITAKQIDNTSIIG